MGASVDVVVRFPRVLERDVMALFSGVHVQHSDAVQGQVVVRTLLRCPRNKLGDRSALLLRLDEKIRSRVQIQRMSCSDHPAQFDLDKNSFDAVKSFLAHNFFRRLVSARKKVLPAPFAELLFGHTASIDGLRVIEALLVLYIGELMDPGTCVRGEYALVALLRVPCLLHPLIPVGQHSSNCERLCAAVQGIPCQGSCSDGRNTRINKTC